MLEEIKIESIPWSKIVHFYGRASEYPKHFNNILNGSKEEQEISFKYINSTIEHQDGIIYATPFVIKFIIDFLKVNRTNKIELLKIIYTVIKSVNFQLEFFDNEDKPVVSITDLLNEQFLWKNFESDVIDEMIWEEWDYSTDYLMWLTVTGNLIKNNKKLIEKIEIEENTLEFSFKKYIIKEIYKYGTKKNIANADYQR